MIDPRTTDIVGERVIVVSRGNPDDVIARGVVRVVDCEHGTFHLLIEADGDAPRWGVRDGGLFQVSAVDEGVEIVVGEAGSDRHEIPVLG